MLNKSDSFTLSADTTRKTKVIGIKLTRDILNAVKTSSSDQPKPVIQLQFTGEKQATLTINGVRYTLSVNPENNNLSDVFRRNGESKALQLVGNITHKSTVQRTMSDNPVANFRGKTEAAVKGKSERKIAVIGEKVPQQLKPKVSPSSQANKKSALMKPSAIIPTARGPRSTPDSPQHTIGTPSANLLAGRSNSDGLSLRTRVVQLLAPKPYTINDVVDKVKASEKEIREILEKVATSTKDQTWQLKPEVYKEVKVYDWAYDIHERSQVVENAKKAFHLIQLPMDSPEWHNLDPPQKEKRVSPQPELDGREIKKRKTMPDGSPESSKNDARAKGGKTATGKIQSKQKTDTKKASKGFTSTPMSRESSRNSTSASKSVSRQKTTTKSIASNTSTSSNSISTKSGGLVPPLIPTKRSSPAVHTIDEILQTTVKGTTTKAKEVKLGDSEENSNGTGKAGISEYKIPKKGSGTGIRVTVSDRYLEPTNMNYKSPRVTTKSESERLAAEFREKYKEYYELHGKLQHHSGLISDLQAAIKAQEDDRWMEAAAKKRYEEAGGYTGVWDEMVKNAIKFKQLHKELDGIKKELYRFEQEGPGGE